MKRFRHWIVGSVAGLLALALSVSGLALVVQPKDANDNQVITVGQYEVVLTIGTAEAATVADYTADGVADDVTFQAAINALPATGGKIEVLGGTYVFTATVSRAINNVTIAGIGKSTYFTYNATNAIFSAGSQTGWVFKDFRTDAGYLTLAADTVLINVWNNNSLVEAQSVVMVAASDATESERAAARVSGGAVCDGTNDEVQLAAVDGGSMMLSSGTFHLDADWAVAAGTRCIGQGKLGQTIIDLDGARIYLNNVSNIELGQFKVTGNIPDGGGGTVEGAISTFVNAANKSNHYFHDIVVAATNGDGFKNYIGTYILSDVLYENCTVEAPDQMGFKNDGDTNSTIQRIRYVNCTVSNAGIAVTRKVVGGESWACGFDFAENPATTIKDLTAINCHVDGAWESGFHFETLPTKINCKLIGCTSRDVGQKNGAEGTPSFGSFTVSGDVTLEDCADYSSYTSVWLNGTGSGAGLARLHLNNFRSFDASADAITSAGTAAGDIVVFKGGGYYGAGHWGLNLQTASPEVVFDGFDMVNPTGSGNIANWLNGDRISIINCPNIKSTGVNSTLYVSDGDDIIISGNRIVSAWNPIYASAADVTRPMVTNNNWSGSTNDIDVSAATNERVANNIDKTGAWAWGDNVQ